MVKYVKASKLSDFDRALVEDLADFAINTTDDPYWNRYTDEEYYDKLVRDYSKEINDFKFVKGVLDLLTTRRYNLGGKEDDDYGTDELNDLISRVTKKYTELGGDAKDFK